ncbi:MAG: 4'-phosphopantetheinyl transferase superfamily protein [Candidatus Ornithospirochaeta sp.]|nr:4'-phosphopantetheinyl transferase superfamily protein [Candidatus Ornithospirochaeta sp.]
MERLHFTDIYIARIDDSLFTGPVLPPERERYIKEANDRKLRDSRRAAWNLLKLGYERSFGMPFPSDVISMDENGKWGSDDFFFSISHSDRYVTVSLSDRECGIDIEESGAFSERFGERKEMLSLRLFGSRLDDLSFLKLWTGKEAGYKAYGDCLPYMEGPSSHPAYSWRLDPGDGEAVMALSSEDPGDLQIFILADGGFRSIKGEEL